MLPAPSEGRHGGGDDKWIAHGSGDVNFGTMANPVRYRAQSWLPSPLRTPAGDIELGGLLHNAMAIPRGSMRVLSRYTLVLVLEGDGYYADSNGVRTRFGPGDVLLVFPGLAHAYGPDEGTDWSQVYVVFDGPQFQLWQSLGLLDPGRPVLRLGMPDHWRSQLQRLLRADSLEGPAAAVRALGQFLQLLTEMLSADRSNERSDTEEAWLLRSMRLLGERGAGGWRKPQEIATQVGLSYENFRKRFARLTGEAPAHFQMRRRLELACTTIYHGERSLKQIASELGFCDVFHFSKAFKRHTGLAPSDYRRRVRGH